MANKAIGSGWLIVYEFMPRGSLDNHIFKGDAWTRAEDLSREQNLVDWAKPFLKDAHKVDPRLEGQYSIEGARKAAALAHQCLSHNPKARGEEKVDHDDEDVNIFKADDYCPSLKLEESDFVMPRKNFPLWRLIANDPLLIKAKIHEWSDGEEFQKVLLKLINTISTGDHEIESVFTAPASNSKYQILPLMSFPTGQTLCDIDHQILD
ncbi:hypothetical protein F8388_010606 [Cannabis sativa]|uniref:Uncharacterized protein n=1 Tax=Cannabis sativa TaxID=3483 RepID=A0A7J6GQH8_CANSA|nr:hypothetical protein F8388_010606 [Cannabis sativa]